MPTFHLDVPSLPGLFQAKHLKSSVEEQDVTDQYFSPQVIPLSGHSSVLYFHRDLARFRVLILKLLENFRRVSGTILGGVT